MLFFYASFDRLQRVTKLAQWPVVMARLMAMKVVNAPQQRVSLFDPPAAPSSASPTADGVPATTAGGGPPAVAKKASLQRRVTHSFLLVDLVFVAQSWLSLVFLCWPLLYSLS